MARKTATRDADAIALLQRDHAEVADLFAQFETAAEHDKEDIADRLCMLLTMHATCEEELLYPAAHGCVDDDGIVFEAEIEHAGARDLVAQIEILAVDDPRFDAAIRVLSEYVRHHVAEEEKHLFPRLRKTDLDLEMLGQSILARREELLNGGLIQDDPDVPDDEDDDDDDTDLVGRRRAGRAANH